MTFNQQSTIQVSPVCSSLLTILWKYHARNLSPGVISNRDYMDTQDFGVKLRVSQLQSDDDGRKGPLELFVAFPGTEQCLDMAKKRLSELYGADALKESHVAPFNICIDIDTAMQRFSSVDEALTSLAMVRAHAVGAPILQSLNRLVNEEEETSPGTVTYHLETHPRCGKCFCISTSEKTLVVFTLTFREDLEQAIARLFCQQFVMKQHAGASAAPHCDFRETTNPPQEVEGIAMTSEERRSVVGYLSFTFFPSHAKVVDRRIRAMNLMTNFLSYIDRHVKGTKTHIHSRLRSKKDSLIIGDLFKEQKHEVVSGSGRNWNASKRGPERGSLRVVK